MRRLLLSTVLATLLATASLAPTAAPASAHGPKAWWAFASPFGSPPSEAISWGQVRGSKRSIDLAVGAGSLYQLRGFAWSGWGSPRATGTGRVRYCSDECLPWRSAKVVLSAGRVIDCYDGAGDGSDEHLVYMRSAVTGFEYLPARSPSKATTAALRC